MTTPGPAADQPSPYPPEARLGPEVITPAAATLMELAIAARNGTPWPRQVTMTDVALALHSLYTHPPGADDGAAAAPALREFQRGWADAASSAAGPLTAPGGQNTAPADTGEPWHLTVIGLLQPWSVDQGTTAPGHSGPRTLACVLDTADGPVRLVLAEPIATLLAEQLAGL